MIISIYKMFTETIYMLQKAFWDEFLIHYKCHEWFKRFKESWTSVEDDPRSGRPSISTDDTHVTKGKDLVCFDRHLTIQKESNISFCSRQTILTRKLHKHRVAAKFVARLTTEHQKQRRVQACVELLHIAPSPLFIRSGPADLMLFAKMKRPMKGRRRHSTKIAGGVEQHS